MQKYLNYIREFQNDNEFGKYFIENQLIKHLAKNPENQAEIEHILDYLYSTKKKFKVGYTTIKEKADKWSKNLQQQAIKKDKEVEGKDYKVIKKWENGFKIVKLISKSAYNRESKLMSHCVASYFGKDDDIYSLRDKNNLPHCTISKSSQQIKGKGNGKIDPKYIKYVVEFLEEIGVEVRDSEMKNLGYVNIEKIKDENAVFTPLFRDKYFYKENKILDKNGNKYENISLWKEFGLLKINTKFEVDLKFDIKNSIDTFLDYNKKNIDDSTAIANREYSTAIANSEYSTAIANGYISTAIANSNDSTTIANGYRSTAIANSFKSTAIANREYSTAVATRDDSTAIANSGDSTAVANRENSTAITNGYRSTAIANNYRSTAITNREDSTAVANRKDSTAVANNYNSTAITNRENSTSIANGFNSTAVANNYNSTAIANREDSTAIANSFDSTAVAKKENSIALLSDGRGSKAKAAKGSCIIIVDRDQNGNITDVKSTIVDGKKIKANTWYQLKNGKFIEVKN